MITMARRGKFRIPRSTLLNHPQDALKAMEGIIIVRAEMMMDTDHVEYTGLSEKFSKVGQGEHTPEYELIISVDHEGEKAFKFKRKSDPKGSSPGSPLHETIAAKVSKSLTAEKIEETLEMIKSETRERDKKMVWEGVASKMDKFVMTPEEYGLRTPSVSDFRKQVESDFSSHMSKVTGSR